MSIIDNLTKSHLKKLTKNELCELCNQLKISIGKNDLKDDLINLIQEKQKTSDKPKEKQTKKPEDKPTKKLANKAEEKPANKAEEKPTKKPADKPANKAEEKPEEKPTKKPEDKPEDKPTKKPTEKQEDRPFNIPMDRPIEKLNKLTFDNRKHLDKEGMIYKTINSDRYKNELKEQYKHIKNANMKPVGINKKNPTPHFKCDCDLNSSCNYPECKNCGYHSTANNRCFRCLYTQCNKCHLSEPNANIKNCLNCDNLLLNGWP